MTRIRVSLLLPVTDERRREAARSVITSFRQWFPSGGSCLSTPSLDPVLWGWWREDGVLNPGRPPDIDRHIMVWVDCVSKQIVGDPVELDRLRTDAIDAAAQVFRTFYAGRIAEKDIYLSCQEITIYTRPGVVNTAASDLVKLG